MFTHAFWAAAGERAVKTFAQTEIAALTLSSQPIDVFHMNWVGVLSVGLGATLMSVLTSLAGLVPATNPTPAVAMEPAASSPQPEPAAADERQFVQRALDRLSELDNELPPQPVVPPPAPVPAPKPPAAAAQQAAGA